MNESMQRNARAGLTGGVLALALLLFVGFARVSGQDTDPRWLPWLGCWESVGVVSDGSMLCVSPVSGDAGVELLTVSDGQIRNREFIRADGLSRDIEREGCQGTERAEFSVDGRRVYLSTDYVCEGNVERSSAGILAFASEDEWLDVRNVAAGGRQGGFVQRYKVAAPDLVEQAGLGDIAAGRGMAVRAARLASSSRLDVSDVIEAVQRADPKAVEALVVERGEPFRLTRDKLVRMADAQVPGEVIDVVVAVTYPRHFQIDRGTPSARSAGTADRWAYAAPGGYVRRGFFDPFFFDPYYLGLSYRFSPFSYGYGYGYGGFGYGGYGYGLGYPGYGYFPGTINVNRRGTDGSGHGRVVRGRGYTRGGSGGSPGASAAGTGSRGVSSRGGSRGSSSRGSSGRTAKRRGGG